MTSANRQFFSDAEKRSSLARRNLEQKVVKVVLFAAGAMSVLTMAGILFVLLYDSIPFFSSIPLGSFFAESWSVREEEFGILPLINGTLMVALIASVIALSLGLCTAIFMSEYAPTWLRQTIKPVLEILGGIPTVVYGYFALLFLTPLLRSIFGTEIVPQFNAMGAGIAVGLLITPMIATLSEDAMLAVPRSLRYSAYALGATRFEVTLKVVVPAAMSGIIAAFILAVSRAIGETLIVTIAAGLRPNTTVNPFEAVLTMTAAIVSISQGETPRGTLGYQSIFAIGLILFVLTLLLNMAGRWVVSRYRLKYE